jgi:putative tricarboxylic transport membrane protein
MPRTNISNRAEDAFRLSMIGSGGNVGVFWSNGLVGSITTMAIALLFWPLIDKAFSSVGRLMRPARATG